MHLLAKSKVHLLQHFLSIVLLVSMATSQVSHAQQPSHIPSLEILAMHKNPLRIGLPSICLRMPM